MKIGGFGILNRKMASIYNGITSSIAFYPVIITFCYLLVVIFMLRFDYTEAADELSEELTWLKFDEMETVRAILTTLIAGIISLMALSFSMVMVVLNQATSTVSPKVMQGLVTKKEHQFVLGNQFGAILYFMVVLLLLRGIDAYKIPTFSVTLGLLLAFWALGLFVYFIHSISQSIQVTNIIINIHDITFRVLQALKKGTDKAPPRPEEDFQTPYAYLTDKPGFLQEINVKNLLKIARKYDMQIKLEPFFTDFVPTGSVLFRAGKPPEALTEKDRTQLYTSILFFNSEDIDTNHVYGFTQLSEIAVKSLSPGINDPGIAVLCLQFLADLFVNLYPIRETQVYPDAENYPRIYVKNIAFESLLNLTITPIRNYGKQDISVARSLLNLLLVIGMADQQKRQYHEIVNQHAEAVLARVKEVVLIPADAHAVNTIIERMLELDQAYFRLRKLEIAEPIFPVG